MRVGIPGRHHRNTQLGDRQAAAAGEKETPLPGPRQLAWLLVQPITGLKAADAAAVARVEQDKEAGIVAGLARRFTALVRACGVKGRQGGDVPTKPEVELDRWLAEARACGVGAIETFAAGLDMDGAAVRAALTLQQRPSRGTDQPPQAPEAAKLRPRQLRPAATARSDGDMIHAKCGRATRPGQSQSSSSCRTGVRR